VGEKAISKASPGPTEILLAGPGKRKMHAYNIISILGKTKKTYKKNLKAEGCNL